MSKQEKRRRKSRQRAEPRLSRDVQGKIGEELRARYEASRELPQRILALLLQLNTGHKRETSGV